MILDTSVVVQIVSSSLTSEGVVTQVWTASQTTELTNIQTISGEIAFKQYGISDTGIYTLFFFPTSSSVVNACRIVYGSDTYSVYRVSKYPNHWEVLARLVVI